MKKEAEQKEVYLVVIWDKADDSFYFMITSDRSEHQAMQKAWVKRLDEIEIPDEDREKEYSKDGGAAGLVPVLAITRADLDALFEDNTQHS